MKVATTGASPKQARVKVATTGASPKQARVKVATTGASPKQARVKVATAGASPKQARVKVATAGASPKQARVKVATKESLFASIRVILYRLFDSMLYFSNSYICIPNAMMKGTFPIKKFKKLETPFNYYDINLLQ